jgi:N-acetylglucosaminyldiphosphoundecaprenol N-acetyl-beta-D-mannosaminyltransferase
MSATVKASDDLGPSSDLDDLLLLDRRERNRTISFLDVDFSPLTPSALFERVVQLASQRSDFRYLVTPNVDQIVRLHRQPDSRALNLAAWLNVNDSRILEVLAGWSGIELPACPGSDLTAQIFEKVIEKDEPIVVIGCSETVIDAIKTRYGLTKLAWHQPPMGLKSNPVAINAAVEFCLANPARFTFVCVGSPQQEMVALAIQNTGKAIGIGLCVGASLEFLAGTRHRAPKWMQKTRLEWLFRLTSEPKALWRRYLVDGPNIFRIWHRWHSIARRN